MIKSNETTDTADRFSFAAVEKEIRKKTFGVISTVDPVGRPHSTGILFGMSPPNSQIYFYVVTSKNAAKVRHIRRNPNVTLTVTFPHHWLRFVPDSTVMFRGTADLVALDDEGFRAAFSQKRMLRMNLQVDSEAMKDSTMIRIRPDRTVYCYGVGIGINKLRKDPTAARYKVIIPEGRLPSLSSARVQTQYLPQETGE
jgi:nitroimidazol reductase NimA-like FMN-containing flavoprotein (pyridoxamine 5'-phosphate oxidase superfamily)